MSRSRRSATAFFRPTSTAADEDRRDLAELAAQLARGGASLDVRANAARAIGILRGKEAVPDLLEAIHTKDSAVIYESLNALQKIRDLREAHLK